MWFRESLELCKELVLPRSWGTPNPLFHSLQPGVPIEDQFRCQTSPRHLGVFTDPQIIHVYPLESECPAKWESEKERDQLKGKLKEREKESMIADGEGERK